MAIGTCVPAEAVEAERVHVGGRRHRDPDGGDRGGIDAASRKCHSGDDRGRGAPAPYRGDGGNGKTDHRVFTTIIGCNRMSTSFWFSTPTQQSLVSQIQQRRATWLVTGAAGFIGSNLVETLLQLGQRVVGLDNFATGHRRNLDQLNPSVDRQDSFTFLNADIRDRAACETAVQGADYVLHHAALGSVPLSLDEPLATHDVNVTGFINMLDAARRAGVKRFVYATSSAAYGDHPGLPQREDQIGNALSPYAASKLANELYAGVYARCFGFAVVGLRYFNIFGPRQDPDGAYAAVIPKWTAALIDGHDVTINGDGTTSRDFCYVSNVVQANLRAALVGDSAQHQVYNVGLGARTSLNELFGLIRNGLEQRQVNYDREPVYQEFRAGDVLHSQADIGLARQQLGYAPTHNMAAGIEDAMNWYIGSSHGRA